ncbi:hypothetical protein JB92DRAFT_2836712 [Gautieria morchelliformis]|nr:hypothetical protein JB92DRAFT_2836712 [Gautieria morchelliformis]
MVMIFIVMAGSWKFSWDNSVGYHLQRSPVGADMVIACQCPQGPSGCFHVEWVRALPEVVAGTHNAHCSDVALVLRDKSCAPPVTLFSVPAGIAGGMKGHVDMRALLLGVGKGMEEHNSGGWKFSSHFKPHQDETLAAHIHMQTTHTWMTRLRVAVSMLLIQYYHKEEDDAILSMMATPKV